MVTGIVPSQKQQRRNSSFHGRKKGIRLVPIQKVPVRIPLQKKNPVLRYRRKVAVLFPLQKNVPVRIPFTEVPVRIPLQKKSGTPLQKKGGSTLPLTEKCAGTHPFY